MSRKGAIHIIESAIAIFMLLSFIILAFGNVPQERSPDIYYRFMDELLNSLIRDQDFMMAVSSKNVTEISSIVGAYSDFKFEIGYISLKPYVFIVNSTNYMRSFSVGMFDRSYIDVFSPAQSFVNVSLNSELVFSSWSGREIHAVDVSSDLLSGTNQIEVNATRLPAYLIIYAIDEQTPNITTDKNVRVAMQPYFNGDEVILLHAFIY